MAEDKKEKKDKKPKGKDGAPAEGQAAPEKARAKEPQVPARPARLRERFAKQVLPELMKELGFKNPMQVPRLEKIVVNMGLGEAINNGKIIDAAVEQLGSITGQKPVVTKARKSIANFKLRQGQTIGAMVTLRGERMYEFLDRLVTSRCRASATSRACRPRRSTGRATTRSAPRADHLPGDQLRQGREDQRA